MTMYLFTRSWRVDTEHVSKALEWVGEITETGRKITGLQIDAWTAVLSPELGTVVWSLWSDSIVQIQDAGDKLTADSGYLKSVEKAADYFDGQGSDGLAALVHGDLDLTNNSFEYVGVATATAANGRLQEAMAAGISIADHVKKVTGDDTLFVVNSTGPFGGCAWLTPMADGAAVDAGEAALMADADWVPLIDRVGTAFAQDAAQSIYRRIA
jgi:hypothetical protein